MRKTVVNLGVQVPEQGFVCRVFDPDTDVGDPHLFKIGHTLFTIGLFPLGGFGPVDIHPLPQKLFGSRKGRWGPPQGYCLSRRGRCRKDPRWKRGQRRGRFPGVRGGRKAPFPGRRPGGALKGWLSSGVSGDVHPARRSRRAQAPKRAHFKTRMMFLLTVWNGMIRYGK